MTDAGVLVKLDGGLGNQMFQYALGRALSLHLGAPLTLDIGAYRSYTTRQYGLGVFDISASTAPAAVSAGSGLTQVKTAGRSLAKLAKKILPPAVSSLRRVGANKLELTLPSWAPPGPWTIYREPSDVAFDQALFGTQPPIYVFGYWHNERYFADYADAVRRDFTLRVALSEKARHFQQQVTERQPSVSLHVRRGDYVRNTPEARWRLDVCGVDYYRRALDFLGSKVPGPSIFVFSDEIAWVKANLKIDNAVYVDGCADYEEMFLMSCCRHHIIANSTFSWWGAWLNADKEKVVIAPKQWVNGDTSGRTPVPTGWNRL
jgi:hypothetical protein